MYIENECRFAKAIDTINIGCVKEANNCIFLKPWGNISARIVIGLSLSFILGAHFISFIYAMSIIIIIIIIWLNVKKR